MAKLKITQTRSQIGQTQKHRGTLRALGLGQIGRSVEREDTPETLGMLRKVRHLVRIEESSCADARRRAQPLHPEARAEAQGAQARRPRHGLGQGPLFRPRDQGPEVAFRLAQRCARASRAARCRSTCASARSAARIRRTPCPSARTARTPWRSTSRPRARLRRRRRRLAGRSRREGPHQEHAHRREDPRRGRAEEEADRDRAPLLEDRAREDRVRRRNRDRAPRAGREEAQDAQGEACGRRGRARDRRPRTPRRGARGRGGAVEETAPESEEE